MKLPGRVYAPGSYVGHLDLAGFSRAPKYPRHGNRLPSRGPKFFFIGHSLSISSFAPPVREGMAILLASNTRQNCGLAEKVSVGPTALPHGFGREGILRPSREEALHLAECVGPQPLVGSQADRVPGCAHYNLISGISPKQFWQLPSNHFSGSKEIRML